MLAQRPFSLSRQHRQQHQQRVHRTLCLYYVIRFIYVDQPLTVQRLTCAIL